MIRRKPSASHCVQNTPDDTYRPSSATLAAGWIVDCDGELAALGRVDDRERVVGEPVARRRQRHPVERDADVLLLLAVEDERRRGVGVGGRIAAERERRA